VLTALARDEDGWVAQVEFFAGDHSLGVVENWIPNERLYLNWSNVVAGEYTLTGEGHGQFRSDQSLGAGSHCRPFRRGSPVGAHSQGYGLEVLDNGSDQGNSWRETGVR